MDVIRLEKAREQLCPQTPFIFRKPNTKKCFEFSDHIVSRFKITKPKETPLTLSCIIFQNGQTYFKNLAVGTPQDI